MIYYLVFCSFIASFKTFYYLKYESQGKINNGKCRRSGFNKDKKVKLKRIKKGNDNGSNKNSSGSKKRNR